MFVCVCQDEGDPATSVEELEKQIEKLSKVNSDIILYGYMIWGKKSNCDFSD